MTEIEDLISRSTLLDSFRKCYSGHMGMENSDNMMMFKSICRIINDQEAIVTIEEFKALKEKFENAKDDIRKLLSSEYGSSCQFCVHDENEDARCCNIGGSGSWCCENARWKEH